jgi:hypothetical protein
VINFGGDFDTSNDCRVSMDKQLKKMFLKSLNSLNNSGNLSEASHYQPRARKDSLSFGPQECTKES